MSTGGDASFELNASQHFRLWIDENEETEQQRKQMEIDNSLRFKLLQARKENIPHFRDYKRVPPYNYLVRKDHGVFKVNYSLVFQIDIVGKILFQSYMARRQETTEADSVEQQLQEKRQTRIDAVRRQGERQLRKVTSVSWILFELTFYYYFQNRCVNKY